MLWCLPYVLHHILPAHKFSYWSQPHSYALLRSFRGWILGQCRHRLRLMCLLCSCNSQSGCTCSQISPAFWLLRSGSGNAFNSQQALLSPTGSVDLLYVYTRVVHIALLLKAHLVCSSKGFSYVCLHILYVACHDSTVWDGSFWVLLQLCCSSCQVIPLLTSSRFFCPYKNQSPPLFLP